VWKARIAARVPVDVVLVVHPPHGLAEVAGSVRTSFVSKQMYPTDPIGAGNSYISPAHGSLSTNCVPSQTTAVRGRPQEDLPRIEREPVRPLVARRRFTDEDRSIVAKRSAADAAMMFEIPGSDPIEMIAVCRDPAISGRERAVRDTPSLASGRTEAGAVDVPASLLKACLHDPQVVLRQVAFTATSASARMCPKASRFATSASSAVTEAVLPTDLSARERSPRLSTMTISSLEDPSEFEVIDPPESARPEDGPPSRTHRMRKARLDVSTRFSFPGGGFWTNGAVRSRLDGCLTGDSDWRARGSVFSSKGRYEAGLQ